ncbi:MAG TPA: PHP domain-containing protein [Anaerolineaceae bacterium]
MGFLTTIRAELHVHTCVSPCAEVEMIPPLIVREAIERGIHLIAITDHNTIDNAEAVITAAKDSGLTALPGMELQTREEVHSLCLFDTLDQARAFETWVKAKLPPFPNRPEYFGEQFVVDATGEFIRREEQLLLMSTEYDLNDACGKVMELGGMFIPAHINRTAFGLLPVLGVLPPDICIDALEVSRHLTPEKAVAQYPQIAPYPLVQGGDAHRLDELLGVNKFTLAEPTIAELRLALWGQEGRSFRYSPRA